MNIARESKFGDSRCFSSLGVVTMTGLVRTVDSHGMSTQRPFRFAIDLVDANIPLLISRTSTQRMCASLDFDASKLLLPCGSPISLNTVGSGRLSFEWIPVAQTNHAAAALNSTTPTTKVFPSTDFAPNHEEPLEVGGNLFGQLHYHLGRADIPAIKRLCDLSGRKFDVELGRKWLSTCACGRNDRIPQNPIVGRHVCTAPGATLLLDATYPSEVDSQKQKQL